MGLSDHLVGVWSAVAGRFADTKGVAGYDLLNEPNYAEEDDRVLGGAWWQWRQTCGDPHSVGTPGSTATEDQIHLNAMRCPGNEDLGPTEKFLAILGRSYPRASPGTVTDMQGDPDTGRFSMTAGGAKANSTLVVWVPTAADDPGPTVTSSTGLDTVYGSQSLRNLMGLHSLAEQAVVVERHRRYGIAPFTISFTPSEHSRLLLGLKVPSDGELTCDSLDRLGSARHRPSSATAQLR